MSRGFVFDERNNIGGFLKKTLSRYLAWKKFKKKPRSFERGFQTDLS